MRRRPDSVFYKRAKAVLYLSLRTKAERIEYLEVRMLHILRLNLHDGFLETIIRLMLEVDKEAV